MFNLEYFKLLHKEILLLPEISFNFPLFNTFKIVYFLEANLPAGTPFLYVAVLANLDVSRSEPGESFLSGDYRHVGFVRIDGKDFLV